MSAQSEPFERCVEQHKSKGMSKEQAIRRCARDFAKSSGIRPKEGLETMPIGDVLLFIASHKR